MELIIQFIVLVVVNVVGIVRGVGLGFYIWIWLWIWYVLLVLRRVKDELVFNSSEAQILR